MSESPILQEEQRVNVVCTYKFTRPNAVQQRDFILVQDVYIDGDKLRDHAWLKKTKRLSSHTLRDGDTLCFTAKIRKYYCIDTLKKDKIGFRHIRNISVENLSEG